MYGFYSAPSYTLSDADYFRALAEERAAREQYAAAKRAQEEARARAARARAARRAYASPYSSYHEDEFLGPSYPDPYDDLDVGFSPLGDGLGSYPYSGPSSIRTRPVNNYIPYGRALDPYSQRAVLEEERRKRELLEAERERERRRLEEERIRKILQEERMREEAARQKLLEEERVRKALEEERIRRALIEEKEERERARAREQRQTVDPLDILRALGIPVSASDSEKERVGRQGAPMTRPGRQTPSPVRPFPFGQRARPSSPTQAAKNTSTSTSIPITSPKLSAKPVPMAPPTQPPTAEQLAAGETIRDAYRARAARRTAFASISAIRKRFLAARNGFALPPVVDYDIPTNGRVPTTVSLGEENKALIQQLARRAEDDTEDVLEGTPRLAYTPTNARLHTYEEELNRILAALDAVESGGDRGVRAARRELARAVEKEAEVVERWAGVVWKWMETQKEAQKDTGSIVDESAPATTIEAASAIETDTAISSSATIFSPAAQPAEPVPAPEVEIADADHPDDYSRHEEATTDVPANTVSLSPPPAPLSLSAEAVLSSSLSLADNLHPTTPELTPVRSEVEQMEVETESEEMDVEPEEVHTPPPSAHVPLVSVLELGTDSTDGKPLMEEHEQERDKRPSEDICVAEGQWEEVA